MYKKVNKIEILEPGKFYHILNRAVGNELLFRDETDYSYFFNKVERFLFSVADLIAYCLIPNHFHFFMRIHNKETILKNLNIVSTESIEVLISNAFSNFFNSYSKTYNLKYSRKGKLFILPYKRILIEENSYFISVINYIHRNPIHHGLTKNYSTWKYSSYNAYLSNDKTKVNRSLGLEFFGSLNDFIDFHLANKVKPGSHKYYCE